jgi:hypothetical protein
MTSSPTPVDASQRFSPEQPCPVCGGHPDLPQGQGIRCVGFLGRDGASAFCTREEYAGDLVVNENTTPPTFQHQLVGMCDCGVDHEAGGVIPAAQHNGHGKHHIPPYLRPDYRLESDELFHIEYPDGTLAGIHVRVNYSLDGPDGRRILYKNYLWKALHGRKVKDLPLYRVHELMREPRESLVYVTEGEKACEILTMQGLNAVGTVTGAGGTPCDESLRPLLDYEVVLWPDADDVGRGHMQRIAARLVTLGAHEVKWIAWEDAPEGGDAADYFKDNRLHAPETLAALVQPWEASEYSDEEADGRANIK